MLKMRGVKHPAFFVRNELSVPTRFYPKLWELRLVPLYSGAANKRGF